MYLRKLPRSLSRGRSHSRRRRPSAQLPDSWRKQASLQLPARAQAWGGSAQEVVPWRYEGGGVAVRVEILDERDGSPSAAQDENSGLALDLLRWPDAVLLDVNDGSLTRRSRRLGQGGSRADCSMATLRHSPQSRPLRLHWGPVTDSPARRDAGGCSDSPGASPGRAGHARGGLGGRQRGLHDPRKVEPAAHGPLLCDEPTIGRPAIAMRAAGGRAQHWRAAGGRRVRASAPAASSLCGAKRTADAQSRDRSPPDDLRAAQLLSGGCVSRLPRAPA